MQNIRAYFDSVIVVENLRRDRATKPDQSVEHVQRNILVCLLVLVNTLAGGSFVIATAFASEFFLMTTFWEGACLGAIIYGLLNIGVPDAEDC